MCCFIVKLTRTGEGSLSKLPTLIDSWPCKYSSGISESTKVDTSTELDRGVLFRIGTGHSIIFMDLDELVPLLGSSTCNIPLFFAFLSKDLLSLLNFPWFDFGFLIKALVSFKPYNVTFGGKWWPWIDHSHNIRGGSQVAHFQGYKSCTVCLLPAHFRLVSCSSKPLETQSYNCRF